MTTERKDNGSQSAVTVDAPATEESVTSPPVNLASSSVTPAQQPDIRNAHFSSFPKGLTTWIPFATSLVSFTIAIYTFVITTRQPEILLILPEQIRIAQGADYGFAYLYFQPTFAHTGESQRVEVIHSMRIEMQGPTDGDAITFIWGEQGKLVYDPTAERTLSYEYVADPSPLLVGPNSAQSPFCTFNGPRDWYFAPGIYRITFVAERAVSGQLLTSTFAVTLTRQSRNRSAERSRRSQKELPQEHKIMPR